MASKKTNNIINESQEFKDAVSREEIRAILKRLEYMVKNLSGNDLELLKNSLRKLFEY
jgi:beta-lactamase class D